MVVPSRKEGPSVFTEAARGVVFNVQRASFHDGPGVRTTVFFKGCPLSCPWCHNPEGISPWPEVLTSAAHCLSCGSCTSACPRPDGPLGAGARLGDHGCLACRACVDACPTGARQVAGREWTASELLAELRRDRALHETSGGGVTFSGGEPLAQAQFLLACLAACRRERLHTAVDTCGLAAREVVLAVARLTDLVLWDVKHTDEARHLELVGAPLAPILANLRAVATVGVPIWLRVPVIPGYNDDPENLSAVAALAAATPNVRRLSLLPYHRTGAGKLVRLGRADALAGVAAPGAAGLRELAARMASAGIETRIGG
jgi:pyruvate formate lyase activating enzyme